MTKRQEDQPAEVAWPKQAGESPAFWQWIEPSVWTDRMLRTLERGVKGGKWFSLIDKVYSRKSLRAAFESVAKNRGAAGVDHQSIKMFARDLEANLEKLSRTLQDGTYRPQAVRRVHIDKPGSKEKRPLGIPTVRDRVVQASLRQVIEPIFERDFAPRSHGFRPGRGCPDALDEVERLLQDGCTFVVDADLRQFFDTIPHEQLMERVKAKVSDGRVLALIESFLNQTILEDLKEWTPTQGTPQGAVLSPLLANIYLDPLDHLMAESGFEMVRYADDFVILCRSREEAERALEKVREWTAQAGLTLHPVKTKITDVSAGEGFDFLGYHFERGHKWPRAKSFQRFRETIRRKTPRTSGKSLDVIITDINRTTRGWFEYFHRSVMNVMTELDKWIRMRLRSILRKRRRRRGRGRGRDHNRWPNAYFTKLGLFSLEAAWAQRHQPTLW